MWRCTDIFRRVLALIKYGVARKLYRAPRFYDRKGPRFFVRFGLLCVAIWIYWGSFRFIIGPFANWICAYFATFWNTIWNFDIQSNLNNFLSNTCKERHLRHQDILAFIKCFDAHWLYIARSTNGYETYPCVVIISIYHMIDWDYLLWNYFNILSRKTFPYHFAV